MEPAAQCAVAADDIKAVGVRVAVMDYNGLVQLKRQLKLAGQKLLLPKWARDGVTFAAALRPFAPDWRWRDDEP